MREHARAQLTGEDPVIQELDALSAELRAVKGEFERLSSSAVGGASTRADD